MRPLKEMNQDINVDVILAAHNGAKYIQAQIESILAQSHTSLRVIVSDDGSSDETVSIVNAIAAKDPRVSCHICQDANGVVQNFNNGIGLSSADYLLFCDQDDVWEPHKIELLLKEIRQHEYLDGKKVPCLGFSNLKVVDENLNIIDDNFYRFSHLNPLHNVDLGYLTWRSSVYGCTTILNAELLKIAGLVPDKIAMHDHWYAFQAARHGKVFYSPATLVNYRQHSANVVGAHQRGISARIKRMGKTLAGIQRSVISARMMLALLTYDDMNHKIPFIQRLTFLKKHVMPYNQERPAYSMIFSILWLING
ncbi:MAG: glycosyltransferase family 2 protein [Enterobacteriaceae bacterium]|nr:glycosyltransferase family 2 protein [Enterobacteriaceae bacterium]